MVLLMPSPMPIQSRDFYAMAGDPFDFSFHSVLGSPLSGIATSSSALPVPGCVATASYYIVCPEDGCSTMVPGSQSGGIVRLPSGTLTLGKKARIQAVADLTGFWLQLVLKPDRPATIGQGCMTSAGVVIDRAVPVGFTGKDISIGGKDAGRIDGIVQDGSGRSLLQVSGLPDFGKFQGPAIVGGGEKFIVDGPVAVGPVVSFGRPLPEFRGTYRLRLVRGYQGRTSARDIIDNVVDIYCGAAIFD